MEEKNEREGGGGDEIEGEKEGEKLNFEVCLTSFTFIQHTPLIAKLTSLLASLRNFFEKLPWEDRF